MIKYNIRQLKIEGATTLYIRRLCEVFFGSITETGHEFTKAFPEHFACYSGTIFHIGAETMYLIRYCVSAICGMWEHDLILPLPVSHSPSLSHSAYRK